MKALFFTLTSCFIACVGSLLLPRFLSLRATKTAALSLGGVLAILILLPTFGQFIGKPSARIEINRTFEREASVPLALELGSMTGLFVEEGYSGGVLRRYPNEDVEQLWPALSNYDRESVLLLWSYNFKPSFYSVDRDAVLVSGDEQARNSFFFTLLPLSTASKRNLRFMRSDGTAH